MATDDDLVSLYLEEGRAALQEKLQERARRSQDYQDESARLAKVGHSFIGTLRLIRFALTRHPTWLDTSYFAAAHDDLAESAVATMMTIAEGALNPGRREMRFLLEQSVQALFVDQQMGAASFEQRVEFVKSKRVRVNGVDHVRDLQLEMLTTADDFAGSLKRAWGRASEYVHPTRHQLEEKLRRRAEGATIGFETVEDLRSVVREFHEVASLVVVLLLHGIGPSFTGDLLVGALDQHDEWAFHANPFVAQVDEHFDYKAERQSKLEEIRARRARRLEP